MVNDTANEVGKTYDRQQDRNFQMSDSENAFAYACGMSELGLESPGDGNFHCTLLDTDDANSYIVSTRGTFVISVYNDPTKPYAGYPEVDEDTDEEMLLMPW